MNIGLYLKRGLVAILNTAAITLGVLIQLVVVVLACLILPDRIADRVTGPVLLIAPVLIGAGSYFIYQRVIGQRRIHADAGRWLEDRSHRSPQRRARILMATQIGLWIPTVFVGVVFLFLPESIGLATHIFHSQPAKLIGYEVPFPVTWIITGESGNESQTWAFAAALDCRGPLRSGFRRYWPLNLRASAVNVITSPSGHTPFSRSPRTPSSTRSVLIGGGPAICREYSYDYNEWDTKNLRSVECSTSKGEILVSFFGEKANLTVFYRSLEYIRRPQ